MFTQSDGQLREACVQQWCTGLVFRFSSWNAVQLSSPVSKRHRSSQQLSALILVQAWQKSVCLSQINILINTLKAQTQCCPFSMVCQGWGWGVFSGLWKDMHCRSVGSRVLSVLLKGLMVQGQFSFDWDSLERNGELVNSATLVANLYLHGVEFGSVPQLSSLVLYFR